MRYADTEMLVRLNDRAVLNDFNGWLKAQFFDEVSGEALHVLAFAIRTALGLARPLP
ncbi:MAG: hypothetical protein H0V68_06510 [Actinobacteria bacterium]|nr:hypothetical protein [Actinomycetota bacterium]